MSSLSERLDREVKTEVPSTRWERVHEAYRLNRETGEISREVYELILMFILGSAAGGIYGGMPASRHARNRYIQTSNAALYSNKLEAVGTSYNAGTRGFIRYGFRWGWRTGVIAIGFQGISTFLAVYRDKTDIMNYAAASLFTGAIYRFNLGIRGMVGGGFVGLLVGLPAGGVLLGLQKLYGESLQEINKKIRMKEKLEKKQEILRREDALARLLQEVDESITDGTGEDDTKR